MQFTMEFMIEGVLQGAELRSTTHNKAIFESDSMKILSQGEAIRRFLEISKALGMAFSFARFESLNQHCKRRDTRITLQVM